MDNIKIPAKQGIEKINRGRRDFYWLKSKTHNSLEPEEGTDVWAIKNQKVSVTLVNPYFPVNNDQEIINQTIDSISIYGSVTLPGSQDQLYCINSRAFDVSGEVHSKGRPLCGASRVSLYVSNKR